MNLNINKFQHFPFHLLNLSPWPIYLSFSLLSMAIGATVYMHGFSIGFTLLLIGFLITLLGMRYFNNNYNLNKKNYFYLIKNNFTINNIIKFFDLILFVVILFLFIYQLIAIIFSNIASLLDLNYLNNSNSSELILSMADSNNSNNDIKPNSLSTESSTTTTTPTNTTSSINTNIIHSNGTFSDGVRSIYIYSLGVLRLVMCKTPIGKTFTFAATVGGDFATQAMQNQIRNPYYFDQQYEGLKSLIFKWKDQKQGEVKVELNKEELSKAFTKNKDNAVTTDTAISNSQAGPSQASTSTSPSNNNNVNNFISSGDNNSNIDNNLIETIFDYMKTILQPVEVSYPNEVLVEQLHGISITLFILSVFTIILLITFIINIIIFLNSDRILKFFKNKYVLKYINLNIKIIGLETIFIGATILYFMYNITLGLHFLCTHPVILN